MSCFPVAVSNRWMRSRSSFTFGTSAPELVVNIFAAINGAADIAIGNVIGSNIANILLILGVASIIYPLQVQKGTIWKEIPFALLGVVLLYIMANDVLLDGSTQNVLTRTDGLALIGFFVIFLYYTFGISKIEGEKSEVKEYSWLLSIVFALGGILGLTFGGKLLVDNAIILAQLAGLSESLIGLTIVAVGTSMPELVTSIIAVRHKQDDIAIGNVVGSNIFNIFWILGFTSTLAPIPFNPTGNFDLIVNILATFLLFGFMFVGQKNKLQREQGIAFVILYIAYIGYLIMRG